jgi:hypothetical protein
VPTGPEYLESAHELEDKADNEQLIGQAHLDIARAQLHATYALIETVAEGNELNAAENSEREDLVAER